MQKQRRSNQETIVQPWGRILVPPEGIHITIPLSSSVGTKAPTEVEDGNFRLSITLLPHHQPIRRKSHTLPTVIPNFVYKNFSPETIREFKERPKLQFTFGAAWG